MAGALSTGASRTRARVRQLARLLLCAACVGGAAPLAHAGTLSGLLNAPAEASAFYQVTCSNDGSGAPLSLVTRVRTTWPAAGPLVSVQTKRTSSATNSTDPAGGDGAWSPLVWVNGGAGVYEVFVDKTASGEAIYELLFECRTGMDGAGVPTGTSISPEPEPVSLPALSPIALLMLAVILFAGGAASAHTQNGGLLSPASATDYYRITCSDDGSGPPASLAVRVRETTSPAPALVSVQVRRGTQLANTTDPVGGDSTFSPEVQVDQGAAVYDVLVDKSGEGTRTYVLEFHCRTGTGLHTGTSITTVQSQ